MISTLATLVRRVEKQPYRAAFQNPTEIGLSSSTPIFLVGLMEKQKYRFDCPSTIRMLEEEYLYRYPTHFYQDQKLSYSAHEVSQSNYIIGKDYTALLIMKHYH
jgi:hypothetical protein